MVNVMRGILITCDPPVKQFILFLEKQEKWGVVELDETHLFVHSTEESILAKIQARLDELQNQNSYTMEEL